MLYIPMSSFIDRTKIINNTRYSVTYTPAEEQEQNRYLTWLFDHEER